MFGTYSNVDDVETSGLGVMSVPCLGACLMVHVRRSPSMSDATMDLANMLPVMV